MMRTYFADTWFFIALLDRRDTHHRQALRLAMTLDAPVATHEYVLSELLAHFSDDGAASRIRAAAMTRETFTNSDVITPDRGLFLRALTRYEQRPDKEYSLVDCMSMVVMEERGITHVLTNDHHFTQAGFTVVNS